MYLATNRIQLQSLGIYGELDFLPKQNVKARVTSWMPESSDKDFLNLLNLFQVESNLARYADRDGLSTCREPMARCFHDENLPFIGSICTDHRVLQTTQ